MAFFAFRSTWHRFFKAPQNAGLHSRAHCDIMPKHEVFSSFVRVWLLRVCRAAGSRIERKGTVVLFGRGSDSFVTPPSGEEPKNWLYPLQESRPSDDAVWRTVRKLSHASAVALDGSDPSCALSSFVRTDGTRLVLVRNNRDVYAEASVSMRGAFGAITSLTADPSLPVRPESCPEGTRFKVKVPPGGAVALVVKRTSRSAR